jgi:uncharacterized membrane protein YGL010W
VKKMMRDNPNPSALMLAPLFVWMEVMFMFGYRPKLRSRLHENTVKAIAEWKGTSKSASAAATKKKA